ncbi:unnamed protein product [Ilex paraguariensis]|uniref:Uncharacterized protein n=1 Tax=Ilex paraguariensis TaxID=185542 RepID=A0ABC8QM32_9AQUA
MCSEYDIIDDQLYETFVDKDVEFVGLNKEIGKGVNKGKGVNSDRGTTMDVNNDFYGEDYDTEELLSLSGSSSDDEEGGKCKRQRVKYPQYNAKFDMVDPQFKLGVLFKIDVKFRVAIR